MRVIVQNDPGHPDNLGHIVTHLGMNLDQRLKEFKQFENDDEAFWEKVINGEEPEVPKIVREGNARLKAAENGVVVNSEIIDSLWEEDFTTAEDKDVIDDLREKLKSLGLDPDKAEEIVKSHRTQGMSKKAPAEPFSIQPHLEWEESKRRLNEQVKRVAKILLNNVNLAIAGTEIVYQYTTLGIRAKNNYVAALMMVNKEVDKRLGKERKDCSTEEFKSAANLIDEVLQILVRRLKKAQSDYKKQNA